MKTVNFREEAFKTVREALYWDYQTAMDLLRRSETVEEKAIASEWKRKLEEAAFAMKEALSGQESTGLEVVKELKAEELLKELAACQSDDLTGSIGFVAFENAGELYLSMTRRVKGEFKHLPLKVSVGGLLEDPEKLRKALRETAAGLGVSRNVDLSDSPS